MGTGEFVGNCDVDFEGSQRRNGCRVRYAGGDVAGRAANPDRSSSVALGDRSIHERMSCDYEFHRKWYRDRRDQSLGKRAHSADTSRKPSEIVLPEPATLARPLQQSIAERLAPFRYDEIAGVLSHWACICRSSQSCRNRRSSVPVLPGEEFFEPFEKIAVSRDT